ncbi:unnamed protein product [Durusdinium trenchii]
MLEELRASKVVDLLINTQLTPSQGAVYNAAVQLCKKYDAMDDLLEIVTITPDVGPCSICHDAMDATGAVVVQVPCGHHFHKFCVRKWFVSQSHLRCPLCNQVFGTWT